MKILHTLIILTIAFVSACASTPQKDPQYSGEYFYNFENSYLTPDGKDEAWCINSALMSPAKLPAENSGGPWGRAHVVVRGKLGPEGSFGGLGACKRVLEVTELVEATNKRGRE
jgi:hypothetical protein